jgi:hypothetical protein
LTRRESQIMEILHRRQRATIEEIREELPNPPSPSSVGKLLDIMIERRLINRDQQFITTGRGDTPAERTFERDWPAWDAARGRVSGPTPRPIRVRRVPPRSGAAGHSKSRGCGAAP